MPVSVRMKKYRNYYLSQARMLITIITYIILLIGFLVFSALIFRYTSKFSYLSPRFKYAVGVFALLSAGIIVLSLYFLMQAGSVSSSNSSGNTTSNSELNF